jgi:hypothetical protein
MKRNLIQVTETPQAINLDKESINAVQIFTMAQQPLHPFTTGIDIRLALSAAFSTQFNSRGFEANYTPAWIATLQGACTFSNRLSIATEPYLSIPGGIINQLELEVEHQKLLERRRILDNAVQEAASNPPLGSRRSDRIPLLIAKNNSAEEFAIEEAERDLDRRREKMDQEEEICGFSLFH